MKCTKCIWKYRLIIEQIIENIKGFIGKNLAHWMTNEKWHMANRAFKNPANLANIPKETRILSAASHSKSD